MAAPDDNPRSDKSVSFADLDWESGEAVRSRRFDDVYYSDLGGLEETRHVFIDGNDLTARFAALSQDHPSTVFTIGELGFGTGLNILALWAAWDARGHDRGRLHLFSVEGFPLSRQDFAAAMKRIAGRWPELAPYAERLQALYPPLVPGFHRLELAADITLTFAIGEVGEMLDEARFRADAWLLDGFSPSRNDAMWREEVLQAVALLSAPEASFATFTVAGAVRRGLEAAGFTLARRPGFGRKREMLTGRLTSPPERQASPAPWFDTRHVPPRPAAEPVTIAGAGIAGASAAWHLRRAGKNVQLYDPAGPAAGASGNPAGLVMPRLDIGETPERAFYAHAWAYTVRLIEQLEAETGDAIFAARGGLMLALSAEDSARHQRLVDSHVLPANELTAISSDEARTIAGCDLTLPDSAVHLYLPRAGVVRPAAFIRALTDGVEIIKAPAPDTAKALICATGAEASRMVPEADFAASLGQIDVLNAAPPACAITFGSYAAPLDGRCVIGATYDKMDQLPDVPPQPDEGRSRRNRVAVEVALPSLAGAKAEPAEARASLRCVTPDRHPVAGMRPDIDRFEQDYEGLRTGRKGPLPPAQWRETDFVLAGLGSRGLVTAPLCAAHLAALITGAPSPLPAGLADMISPARFVVRRLKRGQ